MKNLADLCDQTESICIQDVVQMRWYRYDKERKRERERERKEEGRKKKKKCRKMM